MVKLAAPSPGKRPPQRSFLTEVLGRGEVFGSFD
jgi:hypothetical protein